MVRFYLGYASSGKYKGYAEDFHCDEFKRFRVLVITTSPKRMENMRRAMDSLPHDQKRVARFFWLTTFDQVSPETIFSLIWRSLDLSDEQVYQIG